MEAELRSDTATARAAIRQGLRVRDDWREVLFSVAEARRALPYVAGVARDAAQAFNRVQRCRRLLASAPSARSRLLLCQHRDQAIERLDQAIDECNFVGAHLFDLQSGSVGFHGSVAGRAACLIWRSEDPVQSAWPDLPGA
jgi:hypothetical protein